MPYVPLHPVKQLDFQINRILTYGEAACNAAEVERAAKAIIGLDAWHREWKGLGLQAEAERRFLHAAYYFRLAEFFLREGSEKQEMYRLSIDNFHKIIDADPSVRIEYVPYQQAKMKTFVFPSDHPIGSLVVFGGYDSFIEEFYLAVKEWSGLGYDIYLFEGPGQGETLRRGLPFEPHWEKPLGAVIDCFGLQNVGVIGISWGGYFALRAAAFEPRVSKAVAYDVLYDGFECMTNPFPPLMKGLVNLLFTLKAKAVFNAVIRAVAKRKTIVDWAVSHGQTITGTKSPYDFYAHLKTHSLKGLLARITCDVLLLAGARDHYIPASHFGLLMNGLTRAKSLTGRVFTEEEGGAEHCQVGNHRLASDYILHWLG